MQDLFLQSFFDIAIDPYFYGSQKPVSGGLRDTAGIGAYARHLRNYVFDDNSTSPIVAHCDTIVETALYAGPLFLHYGHFIMESLSRLWAYSELKKIYPDLKVVYCPFHNKAEELTVDNLPSYVSDILKSLSIEVCDIVLVKSTVLVKHLFLPEQGCGLNINIHPSFLEFLDGHIGGYDDRRKVNIPVNKKIYVCRLGVKHKGSLFGEALLAHILEINGFYIFYPERYSFSDQILTYKSAQCLVFAEGTAIHSLVFCGALNCPVVLVKRRKGSIFETQLNSQEIKYTSLGPGLLLPEIYPGGSVNQLHYMDLYELANNIGRVLSFTVVKPSDASVEELLKLDLAHHAILSWNQSPQLFAKNFGKLLRVLSKMLPFEHKHATKSLVRFHRNILRNC